MPRTPVCPDCDRPMEGGYLLDRTPEGRKVANWVEGAPAISRWTGLRVKGQRQLDVFAWRCPRCSLLRLYAPGPDSP